MQLFNSRRRSAYIVSIVTVKVFLILILLSSFQFSSMGQEDSILHQTISKKKDSFQRIPPDDSLNIRGKVYSILISDGDTLVLADMDDVFISSPRSFKNRDEYNKYMRYKAYAIKVYPYAKEAIKIFRKQEYATKNMKKGKRKKYLKSLRKDLEKEFETPLKKLSKTQGKILVKMIEKELDKPMYNLIKNLSGKWKAFYWNQFSKLYGYRLKSGYEKGENPILDVVLQDLDISYDIPKSGQ